MRLAPAGSLAVATARELLSLDPPDAVAAAARAALADDVGEAVTAVGA